MREKHRRPVLNACSTICKVFYEKNIFGLVNYRSAMKTGTFLFKNSYAINAQVFPIASR